MFRISRRHFLKYCGASSLFLAGCTAQTSNTNQSGDSAPASIPVDTGPVATTDTPLGAKAIWLQGSGCSGCSVSFLNRFAEEPPQTAADVLMSVALLGYHPTLMATAGEQAVAEAESFYKTGSFLLVVEGAVPTAFGGAACLAWRNQGEAVTFVDALKRYAERALGVLCVGTCASFGGTSAASPNLTAALPVSQVISQKTIHLAGCPPHPDWIVWALAKLIAGSPVELDENGRPVELYSLTVHEQCPRQSNALAGRYGLDQQCLRNLGCSGPITRGGCPNTLWNSRMNWCVDANAPCLGCTEPDFPKLKLGQRG